MKQSEIRKVQEAIDILRSQMQVATTHKLMGSERKAFEQLNEIGNELVRTAPKLRRLDRNLAQLLTSFGQGLWTVKVERT